METDGGLVAALTYQMAIPALEDRRPSKIYRQVQPTEQGTPALQHGAVTCSKFILLMISLLLHKMLFILSHCTHVTGFDMCR